MKTYHIPVHFYEQEGTDDDLVMIVAQKDYEETDLRNRIEKIKIRHLKMQNDFPCQKDMVDSIFNQLTEEIDCVWYYYKSMMPLIIGDPRDQTEMTGELQAVSVEKLARMLTRLNPGDNLYFYESYDDEEGYSGNVFCATMIKKYESYAIYINCRGGGLPFISDITEYCEDLKKQKAELTEYFSNIENFEGHVYVDSSLVEDDFGEE